MLGIISTYAALFMLLLGRFMPETILASLDLALGLLVVGVLMMMWHIVGQNKSTVKIGSTDAIA